MKKIMFFLLLMSLLSACTPSTMETLVPLPNQTPPPESEAKLDIINFFVYLNHGKYDQAAALYGGSYEVPQGWNPDLDPDDKTGLLQRGCEQNGLQCMQLYSYELVDQSSTDLFVFNVTFRNPDGSQFVLGPCCGADETVMPPVREFQIRVQCSEEYPCKILDLPPYVP